jgi:hypothetical protein
MSTRQQRTARITRATTLDAFGNSFPVESFTRLTDEQAVDRHIDTLKLRDLPTEIRSAAALLVARGKRPATLRTARYYIDRYELVRLIAAAMRLLDMIDGDPDLEEDNEDRCNAHDDNPQYGAYAPLGCSEDDEADCDTFYGESRKTRYLDTERAQ